MARPLIATPAAPCRWAKVLDPNGYKAYDESSPNEWTIELILDPKDRDHAAFTLKCEDLYTEHHKDTRKNSYWLPIRDGEGDDKGLSICRFKAKMRTFKDGNTVKPPVVEDTERHPWPVDKLIGNGSVVRVAFEVYAWKAPSGAGLTFQPKIIQVVAHIPHTPKGESGGDPFNDSPF